ncbi:MAG: hypothetical protein BWY82_00436 [Verrucomicrobia bacterium ADurb.Bin474]|nr:MAG: hypothetical protein BWY82_00436 [Verrucomicrobia bacterium ADurb.Bin474]
MRSQVRAEWESAGLGFVSDADRTGMIIKRPKMARKQLEQKMVMESVDKGLLIPTIAEGEPRATP